MPSVVSGLSVFPTPPTLTPTPSPLGISLVLGRPLGVMTLTHTPPPARPSNGGPPVRCGPHWSGTGSGCPPSSVASIIRREVCCLAQLAQLPKTWGKSPSSGEQEVIQGSSMPGFDAQVCVDFPNDTSGRLCKKRAHECDGESKSFKLERRNKKETERRHRGRHTMRGRGAFYCFKQSDLFQGKAH